MFTGLVESIGEIIHVDHRDDSLRLTIAASFATKELEHGASVCVSGVCLTVVERSEMPDGRTSFAAIVMGQTLTMSTLGELTVGDRVNLERAVRADARLGGHIVQGHVDGTARVIVCEAVETWRRLRFSVSAAHAPLIVDKGSIAVCGVSLTVSRVSTVSDGCRISTTGNLDELEGAHWFEVSLIPETLTATVLGELTVGDRVNLETDILARHVARLHEFASTYKGPAA